MSSCCKAESSQITNIPSATCLVLTKGEHSKRQLDAIAGQSRRVSLTFTRRREKYTDTSRRPRDNAHVWPSVTLINSSSDGALILSSPGPMMTTVACLVNLGSRYFVTLCLVNLPGRYFVTLCLVNLPGRYFVAWCFPSISDLGCLAPQLLPACESWEDYLWAYYKVMVDLRVEQVIMSRARYSPCSVRSPISLKLVLVAGSEIEMENSTNPGLA